MNVVWIEDFDNAPSSATINKFVGSILDSEHFPKLWLGNRDLRETPKLLEEQCRINSSLHVVKLFTKFWDFCDWMDSDGGLDSADIILIDLNLDHAFTPDRPAQKPVAGKEKLAGFFLFHQLTLVRGFPSDRIAFLTANSDDVETFNRFGTDNLLPELICFSKSGQGPMNLGEWLRRFAGSVVTNLRRGVIGGLCEASPQHSPSKLLELADADQMLRSVPALIRHEGVVDRHPESIAYALAVPWEGVSLERTEKSCRYARWMKSCRNALAHRHIGGAISKEELALIAFVALRAAWKFPANTLPHEFLLSRACSGDLTNSPRQYHEIKAELLLRIKDDPKVQEDNEGNFSYKNNRPVKKSASILTLADFALWTGVKIESSAFSLLAAGLWEALSNEERRGASEEPTTSTNHAATLARMTAKFF